MTTEVIWKIRVHGRVQGVSFRAWTAALADDLGIRGWVRNRSDGSVEILAAGPEQALDSLRNRLRQGPPGARVESMEAHPVQEAAGVDFTIERTV